MPTKEECFDRFELIAREILPFYEQPEDQPVDASGKPGRVVGAGTPVQVVEAKNRDVSEAVLS